MRNTLLGAALASLALVGCQSAPSVDEVSDAAATAADTLYVEANKNSTSVSSLTSITALNDGLAAVGESGVAPFLKQTVPFALMPTETGVAVTPEEQGARAAKFLRERIFTKANVESREGDALIFRITGEDVCTDGTFAADPACIASFDRFELRIRATKTNELTLALLLGPERVSPIAIGLTRTSVAFRLDLAGMKASIAYVSSVTGEPMPTGLPQTMEGVLELALEKFAEQDFGIRFSLLSPLKIETETPSNGRYTFASEAKKPLASARFNAESKQLNVDFDLGATDFSQAYKPNVSTSGLAGQRVYLHLGGASFAFSAREGDTEFLLGHVGLGESTTTLSIDSQQLLAIDLNASGTRSFDVKIVRDADGMPLFHLLPGFDLAAALHYAPLAVDSDVSFPAWASDDSYRLNLAGAGGPSFKPVAASVDGTFPGGIKIVEGSLRFETTHADVPAVVVAAGQCLTHNATPADGSHPLLGQYAVVDCP